MFLSAFFVKLLFRVYNTQTKTECYESFTYPPIYLNFTHYNPTGPLYFTVVFYYERFSILPNYEKQTEKVEYNFMRIDKLCKSSILFTTLGNDLKKLHVEITIYLFKNKSLVAFFDYNFYRGFIPGNYNLMDLIKNFVINLDIPEDAERYLATRIRRFYEDHEYISSIKGRNGKLCILNFNNNGVILKSKNKIDASYGLIFGIEVELKINGLIIKFLVFSAFECKTDKKYKIEPVIIITSDNMYEISYSVIYVKHIHDKTHILSKKFEIFHPKYDYIENLRKISTKYKKFFLINFKFKSIECQDGSKPIVYYLQNGNYIFAALIKRLNISTYVEYKGYYPRNTTDPCHELT